MQVENHKEEVPFSHYEGLFRNLDPQAALERLPSAAFDGKRFTLTLLGRTYDITWPDYAISVRDGGCLPGLPTQTFLLRCLLEAREVADPGSWKTFSGDALGELYIQPFTGRCLTRAAFTLAPGCLPSGQPRKAGGQTRSPRRRRLCISFFGPYAMEILVWEGDDEFPPSAQILYTGNFAEGFAAEDRVVAGDILISHQKRHVAVCHGCHPKSAKHFARKRPGPN